jgi:hypothetical protein
MSEVLLEGLVGPFGLTVSLRVIARREVNLDVQ